MNLKGKMTHMQMKSFPFCVSFVLRNEYKLSFKLICLGLLLKYLQAGDLEGAVFHHADSTIVSQDPLAVFLPLDAGDGVTQDVAV